MTIVESAKKAFEDLTGRGKPSAKEAKAAVREVEPKTFMFADDGAVPNNPELPFLVYGRAVALDPAYDPAAVFEQLFAAHGWGQSWRNGIYDYVHYHSKIHEVLGLARGSARVRFGGDNGKELKLEAGDVAVLPAGTGHQRLSASADLLVVGAYPPEGEYDECRGSFTEHGRARRTIPEVPVPKQDPVFGRNGPLTKLWRR
jgi:uncharacterized protein YjlB